MLFLSETTVSENRGDEKSHSMDQSNSIMVNHRVGVISFTHELFPSLNYLGIGMFLTHISEAFVIKGSSLSFMSISNTERYGLVIRKS